MKVPVQQEAIIYNKYVPKEIELIFPISFQNKPPIPYSPNFSRYILPI